MAVDRVVASFAIQIWCPASSLYLHSSKAILETTRAVGQSASIGRDEQLTNGVDEVLLAQGVRQKRRPRVGSLLSQGKIFVLHRQGIAFERERLGKRPLGIGRLRPNVVLYGEDNRMGNMIGELTERDLGQAQKLSS